MKKPNIKCPHLKCESNFLSVRLLNLHLQSEHEGKKPFQCQFCPKTVSSTISLNQHEEKHKNPQVTVEMKKIPCDFCDKKYSSKKKLHGHVVGTIRISG